jgi:hypothetical protein
MLETYKYGLRGTQDGSLDDSKSMFRSRPTATFESWNDTPAHIVKAPIGIRDFLKAYSP